MDGLLLGDDLKQTNIAIMTKDKVSKINFGQLLNAIKNLDEKEQKILETILQSLTLDKWDERSRKLRYEQIGHIFEMATYREMQKEVQEGMK